MFEPTSHVRLKKLVNQQIQTCRRPASLYFYLYIGTHSRSLDYCTFLSPIISLPNNFQSVIMKLSSFLPLITVTAVAANYVCPANPSATDADAVAFGYATQSLIKGYYESVPVNASFFSDLPNASSIQSNGKTMAENTAMNIQGLSKQAMLGVEALRMTGRELHLTLPNCSFTHPMPPNGTAHLKHALYLEATLCGSFIGLGDYFQLPTLNSLSARLAAEHGIHASAIRAQMQPVGFRPNSTMLTPAFTPNKVLQKGTGVGMLGSWLGGCVSSPKAPCNGTVSFGPLLSNLVAQSNRSVSTSQQTRQR